MAGDTQDQLGERFVNRVLGKLTRPTPDTIHQGMRLSAEIARAIADEIGGGSGMTAPQALHRLADALTAAVDPTASLAPRVFQQRKPRAGEDVRHCHICMCLTWHVDDVCEWSDIHGPR